LSIIHHLFYYYYFQGHCPSGSPDSKVWTNIRTNPGSKLPWFVARVHDHYYPKYLSNTIYQVHHFDQAWSKPSDLSTNFYRTSSIFCYRLFTWHRTATKTSRSSTTTTCTTFCGWSIYPTNLDSSFDNLWSTISLLYNLMVMVVYSTDRNLDDW